MRRFSFVLLVLAAFVWPGSLLGQQQQEPPTEEKSRRRVDPDHPGGSGTSDHGDSSSRDKSEAGGGKPSKAKEKGSKSIHDLLFSGKAFNKRISPETGKDMEAAMMAAAIPGAHHKLLGRLVGDWTYTNRFWMAPAQPPMEVGGTIHSEWILGGRFVQSTFRGSLAGTPFEGRSLDGYDNVTKKFVSSWIDNMGTGILNGSGSCDEPSGTCTITFEIAEPMTGKMIRLKNVTTYTDSGFKLETFFTDSEGLEVKTTELTATRDPKEHR